MKNFTFFSRHISLLCLLFLTFSKSYAQHTFAGSQNSSAGGVLCVGCVVTNQANAADGNLETYSTLNVTVGVLASTYQDLIFPAKVAAGTPVTIKLGTGNSLLDLTALGGITIQPYNGTVAIGSPITAATLVSTLSNNNQVELVTTPALQYDRVRVTLNGGVAGAVSSIYLYEAFYKTPGVTACNTAFDELHGISPGLLNLGLDVGGVQNPQNAIDGNLATASTLNAGVGLVGAYAQQTIIYNAPSVVGDSVRITFSIPQALIDAGIFSNITLSTFNGGTANNDSQTLNSALLNVRLLDLTGTRRKLVVTYAPSKIFDRVQVTLGGGIANVLSTLDLYEAEKVFAQPIISFNGVVTNNAQTCAGSSVTLLATALPNTTFNWYTAATGGTPVFTGASFATPPLTATTSYYVSASRTGCTDASARTKVTVTGNQIPAAPVITNNNVNVCPGTAAVFAAAPVTGVTVNWYAAATGGTPLFTGNTYTTAALSQTTNFFAEAVAGGSCISTTRTKVTATVTPLPAAPALTAANVSICDGDVAILSIAAPVAGTTYNWYSAATGGTILYTGTNFTTPALHATTNYYAEAASATGCLSATRTTATVTVQPKPADPVLATNNLTITAGQTATINVSNAQTGITYNWYTSSTAATPIFTGNTFTTPSLYTNTTYYVSGVNATGCQSVNRTAVTISVTVNNNSPCTFANTQTSSVNNLCVGCSIANNALATDADTTTASTINVLAGLLGGNVSQTMLFQQPGFIGDTVKVVLQTPVALASVGLLSDIVVSLYNGASLVGSYALNNSLIKLQLLGGGSRYAVYVRAIGAYDRVMVQLNSVAASLLTSLQIYYAAQQYPKPVINPASTEVCQGSTAQLNITSPTNGTFNWYTTPTGGTSVFIGANFTTPALNANTTYYIEYSRNGCVSPVRYPLPLTVDGAPTKPVVIPASATITAGQTPTFKATAPTNATVQWFTAATGGTPIFTGATFTTPALTANTTYYAQSALGSCVSVDRTVVPVTVNPLVIPDITVTPPSQAVATGTSATFTASSTTPGAVFNWYTTPTGGTSIYTGATFMTSPQFANATFYAEASIPATGAVSAARAVATVTVNVITTNPVPCDAAISQTNTTSGLLCVLCAVSNPAGSVDANSNTFSQLDVPVGLVGGYAQQTLQFASPARAGDSVVVSLGIPGTLASVGLLSQISLATYNGTTYNNDRFSVNGALISVTLLNGTTMFRIAFKATADFDRVEVRLNSGVSGVLSALNIYYVAQEVAAPVISAASVTACAGTQATLTATVPSYETVKWYTTASGGTPIFTGSSFNTPVLSATTTYYAEASRTADGCAQAIRTPVTVTVTPTPAPAVINTPTVTVCSGQPAIFTANAVAGVTFNWYTSATGGTPVFTGNPFITPALNATTMYYAEAVGTGLCGSAARTQVTANVTATPVTPTVSQTPVQTCSGSSAVLNASSAQPGVIFNWYTASTGGTPVFTGPQYVTPALTSNTSYYVDASSGACTSSARARADVIVNPAPAAPTVTITPSSAMVASGQKATLHASSTTPGVIFNWYSTVTGGTAIFTGANFVTPALTTNTTYYVESALTATGCTSPQRTAVTIRVNQVFSTSCDFASTQTTDVNGGLACVLCSVTNPNNAVDADTTSFSTLNLPVSVVGSYVAQTLIFGDTGSAGDTVSLKIALPASLLNAGILNQIQIASYDGATYNNDRINLTNNLLSIQLLSGNTVALIRYVPKGTFDRVEVRLNSAAASVLNSLNIYYASKQVGIPILTAKTVNVCAGSPATFSINNPKADVTYKWYANATGGAALFTGTTFTTTVSATTTFYVEASRTSNGCANPNRVAVSVNVTPSPVNPVLAQNNASICAGNNVTFTVTNAGNNMVNWYDAATNGTLLFTGASFTTSPVSSTSYYAEITNGSCMSPVRTKATVTVNPLPSQPGLVANNVQVCAGSTATLQVLTPQAGVVYNWYTASTGGAPVFTGATFLTPAITINTIYYVEAANTATGCINTGGRVAASISVNSAATAPTLNATATQVCSGGSVTLSVTNPVAGQQYNWFTAATGGTPIFTGTDFTASNLTANVSYFVEALTAAGCISTTRTETDVTVLPIPTAPQVQAPAGGLSACMGSDITISIANPQVNLVYRWFDAATGGNLLYTGTEFTTPPITAATTYYVEAADAGNCNPSVRTPVTVTPNALPVDPTVASANVAVCLGSSATLSIASPQAGVTYNWYDSPAQTNLLFTGINFTTGPITGTTNFYVSAVNASGCASNNLAQVQVTIQAPPSAPVITNGSTVQSCTGATVTLTVDSPQAGFTYNWYTAATGGTPVFTGNSFTTPALTANTSYFVEAVNSTGCASTGRTEVDIINTLPNAPTITDQAGSATPAVCAGSTATLIATSTTANVTFNWYTAAIGGTPLFTGATFTTPAITTATTYYAEAVGSAGCISGTRTAVTISVTPPPAAPVIANTSNNIAACDNAQVTISIANPQPGFTYNWYSTASGGSSLFTGTDFTTPVLSNSVTYYAEAENSSGCPSATRAAASVIVASSPGPPTVSAQGTAICSGTTATLTATSDAGITVNWYADATSGTILASGNSFTTPALSANTTYYAGTINIATGCSSPLRVPVTVNITQPLAAPDVSQSASTETSVTFTWTAVTGAAGYEVSIDNGKTFTAPSSGSSGLTDVVSDLKPDQSVTVIVRTIGTTDCQLSADATATGKAGSSLGDGIFVPNVFTPNGDGNNDIFYVYGTEIKGITLSIYDQWGELQFRSQSKSVGWDGTWKGRGQPVGVYVYFLEATMSDGSIIKKKGTVTLLR